MSQPRDLRHLTVVITGASAGVGRAVAHRFARAGAKLALIARDAEALAAVEGEVRARWGQALRHRPLDVADAAAVFDRPPTVAADARRDRHLDQ